MSNKSTLAHYLDKRAEQRFGRIAIRLACLSVCPASAAIAIWAAKSGHPYAGILAVILSLFAVYIAGPLSRWAFPDVLVSHGALSQIEREEGWIEPELLKLFYAKHGVPLDQFGGGAHELVDLPPVGSSFDVVVKRVLMGRRGQYPIDDVCNLFQVNNRLAGIPCLIDSDPLGVRAVVYYYLGISFLGSVTVVSFLVIFKRILVV